MSELSDSGCSLCPICNKNEIRLNEDGSREGPNVCVDCEKITCPGCGELNTSLTTKVSKPTWRHIQSAGTVLSLVVGGVLVDHVGNLYTPYTGVSDLLCKYILILLFDQ